VTDPSPLMDFFAQTFQTSTDAPEEVEGQRSQVRFIQTGGAKLELVEALGDDAPIAKFLKTRGPGLHHVAFRVSDVRATIAVLVSRGVRMIDTEPRRGAHGALIAFVHPSSSGGVLVELKQLTSN
jgi:methylmalonyl-CoA/ethylmalonyl-CoA epimerase